MTTPPGGHRPPDPPKPPPAARPASGAGLAAPRPGTQPVKISVAAAAEALVAAPTAAPAGQATGAPAGGRGTAESERVGAAAGASTGTVLGERAGAWQGQAQVTGRGQATAVGRGQAAGSAAGAAAAAAVSARGIGRRESEPVAEVEPETLPPVASTPVVSSPVVSLFGIRAGQLVSCELAILGVALVHRERMGILIPVSVAALLVLALTLIRRRGHFLYQWLALWVRYRTRRRRRIIGGESVERDEVARILLASVARSAEITPVEIEDVEVALISHAGGLTAVLEVVALDAGGFTEPSQALPPLTALLPTAELGRPVVSVQVIIQSIPAPNFLGLEDSAAISYRELAGGVVPATRGCWISLQAQHVAEDYTAADLQDSVTRAVTRLQRRLRKAGLRARILNRDEIATELLTLARVQPREAALTGSSRRQQKLATPAVTEHWRTWTAGPQVHTTFRLLAWPDLADADGRELLDRLVHPPTLATTVSVAARWRPAADDVELEAAIRVTLPDESALDLATEQIREVVEGLGGRLERLDGEQVFGVAGTLPLGGFVS